MPQQTDGEANSYGVTVQRRLQQLPVFARELLAGGAAGGLAKTCVAPLERTKIIFQTRGGQMTVSGVLTHIWNNEGVPGLFRGNTASVLRIVPYAAIHFGSYEYIRRFVVQLSGAEGGHGPDAPASLPVYDLLAGSASGALAVVATYPLDLVRTRLAWASETPGVQQQAAPGVVPLQRQVMQRSPGIWSTLRGTVVEEGVSGLYRGCAPTLLGILPYAGLKFYVYQAMKNSYRSWRIKQQAEQQQQQQLMLEQAQQQHQQQQQQQQEGGHADHAHLPPAPPFETALQQVQVADDEEEEQLQPQKLPIAVTLVFGGVAGLVAQTVTYPLDVIRRQMQVAHLQLAPQATTSSSSSSGGGGGGGGTSGRSNPHGSAGGGTVTTTTSTTSSSSSGSAAQQTPGSCQLRSTAGHRGCSGSSGGRACIASVQHTQRALQQPGSIWPRPDAAAAGWPPYPNLAAGGVSSTAAAAVSSSAPAATEASRCPGSSTAVRQVVQAATNISQQLRGLSSSSSRAGAAAEAAEPSMKEVATKLWLQGGLFRGLTLNFIKVVPSTAIGFTVYDFMKAYLGLSHT